ncbi:hypothetical protein ACH5RR_017287 [Cinchona calisaya]|uniref:Growth-regulating factor n=1 Tax=Cinchona calisaya TaxID=153742 RepID=A0ABD2ZZN4_9GENT
MMGNGETASGLSLSGKASQNMEESSCSSTNTTTRNHHHLHRTESFPSNNVMMGHHHHRPFLSSFNGCDDDGGGGPNQNHSGATEVERPTPPTPTTTSSSAFGLGGAVASSSVCWTARGGCGSAAAAAVSNTSTFDDSCSLPNKSFKSPGGGGGMAAAAALGFPFTVAQWKELERQAMIYKYMMEAMPVPSHLLLSADPIITAAPWNNNGSSLYNMRYANRDLEPGRCKRTDGKKWRCSRDVAPHQKYCERHLHRGRPRSRKPVELHSDNNSSSKKSRLHHSPPTPLPQHPTTAPQPHNSSTIQPPKDAALLLDASTCQNIFASSSYKEPNRVFGWAMDDEVVAAANGAVEQHWLHLLDTKRGLPTDEDSIYGTNASYMQQGGGYGEEEPLNLFSYTDFGAGNIQNRNIDQCRLFLNSDHIDQHCTSSVGFIDAWSDGDLKTINESSVPSSEGGNNLPHSSLTLSMAMVEGSALDEGMRLGADSDHHKPKDCPVSWMSFNSGGPLAEVLQPSSIASGSNPTSPYTSNGDSISPPATAVSSPTGILQKAALFPQSDSSVCNSPTLAASAAPPEVVAFQWLS